MKVLDSFLQAEQCLNNYSLYGDEMKDYFNINLSCKYLPQSQQFFRLPYFIIPFEFEKSAYNKNEASFFERNIFLNHKGHRCYRFFIHPATKDLFVNWINGKYDFVSEAKSEFEATPTSSFRSLLVFNKKNDEKFIAKVSLFSNVANGARHIDWNSAIGQFESSQMTSKTVCVIKNFSIFEDIGAFGLSGNNFVYLSERFDIKIGNRKIETFGNVIRKIPDDLFLESKKTVCSVASFTSLLRQGGSFIFNAFKNSKLRTDEFLDNKIFYPIFNLLIILFNEYGIVLEPHCQNVMIEIDEKFIPTGKIYYRDFDFTTFDRARFPILQKDLFLSYIKNRPDRTIFLSNLGMRENIGIGFFWHFLNNLIRPCAISLCRQNVLSDSELNLYFIKKQAEIKKELKKLIPLADSTFIKDKNFWSFNKRFFSKIDKSEIPTELISLKDIKDKGSYKKLIIENGIGKRLEYFESENGIIYGFYKNYLCEILLKESA